MRHLLVYIHTLVIALVLGIPSAVLGLPPAPTDDGWKWIWERGEKKWLPQFEITARPGNHDLYGMELDPFIPIGQDADSLVFVNVRSSLFWNDGDFSNEINAGMGYRRLMGDRSWILGGYAFYDFMDSQYDNHFNQGTLGIEALAWNWEARMNGYIAENDTEWAPGAESAGAFLVGNRLLLNGAIEQAMSGFDAEVGWRLPFFGEEGALSDTRLYAGGFWFDGSAVGSLGGPMTRFETRLWEVPFLPAESRVTLGTEYRWDHARNHQVTGLIAVRVPLGGATRSQPLTNVERRMTDRVVRDVSVVTDTSTQSSEAVRTRTGAIVGDALFFDDDTDGDGTFEDPGYLADVVAAGGENALLIGLDTTGDVELPGTQQLLNGQTVMGGGTGLRVWGVSSGQTAVFQAPGSPATITVEETIFGTALRLAESNTIEGLGFRDLWRALELELNETATITDVYNNRFWDIHNAAVEVDVENDSALLLYLTDNSFELYGAGQCEGPCIAKGLDLYAQDTFGIDLQVHGNAFFGTGEERSYAKGLEIDLYAEGEGPSSFALNASGNTFMGLDYGIDTHAYISGGGAYTHTATIADNDFVGVEAADYALMIVGNGGDPPGETNIDVAVRSNRSVWGGFVGTASADEISVAAQVNGVGAPGDFVQMLVDPIPDGHIDIEVVDNQVLEAGSNAISIGVLGGPDVDALIARNELLGVDGDAIRMRIAESGDENGHAVTIRDNVIAGIEREGIYVDVYGGLATDLTIANNDLTAIGRRGIKVAFDTVGDGDEGDAGNTITVSGNTLKDISSEGIQVRVDESDDTAVTVADNSVSFVDDRGILVTFDEVGHDVGNTIAINRNTVEFTNDEAIRVRVGQGDDTALTIADNDLSFIDDRGIDVDFSLNGHDVGNSIAIDRNTVEFASWDGIRVIATDNYDTTLGMAGNDLLNIGSDGIDVAFLNNGHDVGNAIRINGGNTIAFADGDGIRVDVDGDAPDDMTVWIALNTIEHVGEDGIEIDFNDVVDGEVTVQGNVVDGSDHDGIQIDVRDDSDGNEITVAGNQVSNSLGDGIDVYFGGGSGDNVLAIQSNVISHIGDDSGDGVRVGIDDGSDLNEVTIANNVITDTYQNGITIGVDDGSDQNLVTIRSNQISRSQGDGLDIEVDDNSDSNEFVIHGNTIFDSGEDGMSIDIAELFNNSDDNLVRIGGNSIDLSGEGGINIEGNDPDPDTTLSSEINGVNQNNTVTNSITEPDIRLVGELDGSLLVNGVEVSAPAP